MREKPDTPPSVSYIKRLKVSDHCEKNEALIEKDELGIFESTIILFKNKNFNYLLINFTVFVGFYSFFYVVANQLLDNYGFTENESNSLCAVSNFSGIVGIAIFTILGTKMKKFKLLMLIMNFLITIVYLIFTINLSLGVKSIYVYYIVFVFLGSLNSATFVFGIEFACELTYPINESISSGILFVISQLFAYAMTAPMSLIISSQKIWFHIIVLIMFTISFIFTYLIKGIFLFRKFKKKRFR